MKIEGIKNLLIDFGGVLVNLDRERCISNFKKIGINNIGELLTLTHHQGVFLEQEKGLINPDGFRKAIREMASKDVTDEQIDAAWNSFLVDIPVSKLKLLLKLREKYVVYLLSNTNEIHWKWSCANAFPYRGFKVEDYFEKIYLSYEMKKAKPDLDIFEAVVQDAGIIPEDTLFIDGSEANCATARTLGIATYTPAAGEDWSHLFK